MIWHSTGHHLGFQKEDGGLKPASSHQELLGAPGAQMLIEDDERTDKLGKMASSAYFRFTDKVEQHQDHNKPAILS